MYYKGSLYYLNKNEILKLASSKTNMEFCNIINFLLAQISSFRYLRLLNLKTEKIFHLYEDFAASGIAKVYKHFKKRNAEESKFIQKIYEKYRKISDPIELRLTQQSQT